jgi:histidine phosphotransferase ChpT
MTLRMADLCPPPSLLHSHPTYEQLKYDDSMVDPLTLTQALCTRLCHDLAGPIGAVSAGVELVGGDPAQVDAEMLQLIANSSAAAAQKLKFLRVALGTPASTSSLTDFKTIAEGYLASVAGLSGPASVEWPTDRDLDAASHAITCVTPQILANLIVMAIEVVPRLRKVVISLPGRGLAVEAQGEISARLDPRQDLIALLADPAKAALTPKTVQALYALGLAGQGACRLVAKTTEKGCEVSVACEPS